MGEEKGIASCLPGGGLVKRIDGVVYQIWRQLLAVGGSTILIFSEKRSILPTSKNMGVNVAIVAS